MFPPKEYSETRSSPADLADPWEGPSTYAEDFYSGGEVPTSATDAHNLPAEGEHFTENVQGIYHLLFRVRLSLYVDEFLPESDQASEELPPVQIMDKWEGPRIYAEDYYAGGDMLPSVASAKTPSHLTPSGTPGIEYDEANFISPGVLTPKSPSAEFATPEAGDGASEPASVDAVPTFAMPQEPLEDTAVEATNGHLLFHATTHNQPVSVAYDSTGKTTALHERVFESPQVSPLGHVDWNEPPAFGSGRSATAPGHLKTLSDAGTSSLRLASSGAAGSSTEPEVLVISDDDDEPEPMDPLPLGTSDLEIPADAAYGDEGRENKEEMLQDFSNEIGAEIIDMFEDGRLDTDGGFRKLSMLNIVDLNVI